MQTETQNLEDVLRGIYFLKDIPYSLHDLASKFSMTSFEKDAVIITEGNPGSCLYILMSGKVLLYSKSTRAEEMVMQTLQPPDNFGGTNLFEIGKWSFSAKALENSILYCLDRDLFMEFLQGNPLILNIVIATLGARIKQLELRNKILTNINAKLSSSRMEPEPRLQHNASSNKTTAGITMPPGGITKTEHISTPPPVDVTAPGPHLDTGKASDEQGNLAKRLEKIIAATARDNVVQHEEISKDMLYNKKNVCPLCHNSFESPKVLSKYVQVDKIDRDFCKHYKYADPLFYEIYVCPRCGFAFNEDILSMRLKKESAESITTQLSALWGEDMVKNYCQERSLDDALETFLLAIYCLGNRPIKKSQLSMLHLKTAWLYRHKGDSVLEKEYMVNSVENLSKSFEKESFSSVRGEINATYLLGVLNFETGDYHTAAKWLERVLRHKSRNAFPMIIDQARDVWAEVRTFLREEEDTNA